MVHTLSRESHSHNLAFSVLHVPSSIDRGDPPATLGCRSLHCRQDRGVFLRKIHGIDHLIRWRTQKAMARRLRRLRASPHNGSFLNKSLPRPAGGDNVSDSERRTLNSRSPERARNEGSAGCSCRDRQQAAAEPRGNN